MLLSVIVRGFARDCNKLVHPNRLRLIPQRPLHCVQRDPFQGNSQLLGSCIASYGYPCNYESRRYVSRRRSVKIPSPKPLVFPDSGEIDSSLEYLDPQKPKPGFNVPELEECNDAVKKIYSIGFADGRALKEQRLENILSQVKEHPADIRSLEVKIAKMTLEIRTQMKHLHECRKDKFAKRMLHERLQKRRSWVNKLRKKDVEKFDWLLKELKIKYIPFKEFNFKLGKRALAKKAARDKFLAIKKQRMAEFSEKLEAEREAFDKVKEKELESIQEELRVLGVKEYRSLQKTIEALKYGKPLKREKRKTRRERNLEAKFELYKPKTEESHTG